MEKQEKSKKIRLPRKAKKSQKKGFLFFISETLVYRNPAGPLAYPKWMTKEQIKEEYTIHDHLNGSTLNENVLDIETWSPKTPINPNWLRFTDSPDTGHPDCLCSSCRQVIPEQDMATRIWPMKDELTAEEIAASPGGYEYRLCEKCAEDEYGIRFAPRFDFDGFASAQDYDATLPY